MDESRTTTETCASWAVPFESLNLHLTGDMHAVTAAHNQLSAMLDNHLHMGNALGIDQHAISWRRVLDVNDRALPSSSRPPGR